VFAAATARLARRGVLVTHPDALETLAKATHVLWDKTGTLTRGLVRVDAIMPLRDEGVASCLALAAALERHSEHPIARAFLAHDLSHQAATAIEVHEGLGIEGVVNGRRLRIGSCAFAWALAEAGGESGANPVDGLAHASVVYLGDDRGLIAAFRLADTLRSEATASVVALTRLGLASSIVSGDAESAVIAVARRTGVTDFRSRLTPAGKLERLRSLQADGAVVVAVGDGINDAPLLRGADVAVAMGRGSALAQHSAQLVLVRETLDALPEAVRVARQAQRVARQNLAWAIGYNLIALPLAALGLVPAWIAALGMSLSSVLVVLNATRLARMPTPGTRASWLERSRVAEPA